MVDYVTLLQSAVAEIRDPYFSLPVAGRLLPKHCERVYCYELFHRLRLSLGDLCPLALTAEVSKSGHPAFGPNGPSPDLILHSPGDHERNELAVEVKCSLRLAGLKKDLKTFQALHGIGYRKFAWLFFGLPSPLERIETAYRAHGNRLPGITVLLHPSIDQPLQRRRLAA